jgi:hypothetical protein
MLEMAKARLWGIYALNVYLPASILARPLRKMARRLRGAASTPVQNTRLPQVAWSGVLKRSPIRLVETRKRDGNVNLSELAVLAQAAFAAPPNSEIIEIGTFDGRTSLNFAINAGASIAIATLDLPAHQGSALASGQFERRYIDKPASGERLRLCHDPWRIHADRVVQLQGDSATFDWSAHHGRAALVFVDGAHSYEYVRKDSETAMRLVMPKGVVMWHDYGVWPGVTRALEELEDSRRLGLVHIRGTSLVFWRAPDAAERIQGASAGQKDED